MVLPQSVLNGTTSRCQIQNQHIYGSNQFPPLTHAHARTRVYTNTHKHTGKLLVLRCDKVCECLKYRTQKFRMSKTTHSYYTREQMYIKNWSTLTQVPQNVLSVFISVCYEKKFQSNVLLHFTKEILCHHYHYNM